MPCWPSTHSQDPSSRSPKKPTKSQRSTKLVTSKTKSCDNSCRCNVFPTKRAVRHLSRTTNAILAFPLELWCKFNVTAYIKHQPEALMFESRFKYHLARKYLASGNNQSDINWSPTMLWNNRSMIPNFKVKYVKDSQIAVSSEHDPSFKLPSCQHWNCTYHGGNQRRRFHCKMVITKLQLNWKIDFFSVYWCLLSIIELEIGTRRIEHTRILSIRDHKKQRTNQQSNQLSKSEISFKHTSNPSAAAFLAQLTRRVSQRFL